MMEPEPFALERITSARFEARVIAFPELEVEISGWVRVKAEADEISYSVSIMTDPG